MNASVYGASRIGYALVERGQGPRVPGRVSGGVPRVAVLVSSLFCFGCVLLSHWRPDDVFSWLLNMIGAVILVVVRMWGGPWPTWAALAGMAGVFVLMAREPDTRVQLYSAGGMTLVPAGVGYAWQRRRARA